MSSKPRLRRRSAVVAAVLAVPASAVFVGPTASYGSCDDPTCVTVNVDGTICWEKGSTPTHRPVVVVKVPGVAKDPISVVVDTADGTAVAPDDYAPIKGQVVTIPAGANRVEVPVEIHEDAVTETDEWFRVTISNPSIGKISKGTARVIIHDGSAPEK